MKFTPVQQKAFDIIAADSTIQKDFYFTGGTALAVFHFGHRYSEDLDFFSYSAVPTDITNPLIQSVSTALGTSVQYTQIHDVHIYKLVKNDKLVLKIDFAKYPYKRIEDGSLYQSISIDSVRDIGANKIAAISIRKEIKDFVDLYFILQTYTIWDLLQAYSIKFSMELDLILFTANLLTIEEFDYLPKMTSDISLSTIKKYFLNTADRLGKSISE